MQYPLSEYFCWVLITEEEDKRKGILISYIAVSLIICILYGMIIFSLTVIKKTGLNIKGNYLFQIWSGIVILAILYFDSGKIELFGNVNLHEWFIISALMLIAIVPLLF